MATQNEIDIRINTAIDAGNSSETVRELRRQIVELNAVALRFGDDFPEAARRAQREAALLADRVDDVRENISDLKGEPLERIRASIGRLGEGFANLDFGKITSSFKNLGSAVFSVTGVIGILIAAVALIVENFDTLKNSGGLIGSVFTAIGNAVEFLKTTFIQLAASIGLVDAAMVDEMINSEKNKKAKEELTRATKERNDETQREIELLKSKGVSELDILKFELKTLDERIGKTKLSKKQLDDYNNSLIKYNRTLNDLRIEESKNIIDLSNPTPQLLGQPKRNIFEESPVDKFIRTTPKPKSPNDSVIDNEQLKQDLFKREILLNQIRVIENKAALERQADRDKLAKQAFDDFIKKTEEDSKRFFESEQLREKEKAEALARYNEEKKRIEEENKKYQDQQEKELLQQASNEETQYQEKLKRIRDEQKAYEELGSTFDDFASKFNAGGNLIAESITKSFSGIRQSISKSIDAFKDLENGGEEATNKFYQAALSTASSVTSAFGDILNASIQSQVEASKKQTDERINDLNRQLDAGTISQEQFNQKKYELDLAQYEAESELKRKAFEQNKAIQIVTAIILSAQAALAAYVTGSSLGPFTGPIFAGIAAAFGAVQVALIASQQYPGDGAAPSRPSAPSPGAVPSTIPNALAVQDLGGRLTTQNVQEETRVYVLEKDITSAQGRTAQIKNRSRR